MTLADFWQTLLARRGFLLWTLVGALLAASIFTTTQRNGVEGRFAILLQRQDGDQAVKSVFDFDYDNFYALRAAEVTIKMAAEFLKDPVFVADLPSHYSLTPRVYGPQYLKLFFKVPDEAMALALRDGVVKALNLRLASLGNPKMPPAFVATHADFEAKTYQAPLFFNLILATFLVMMGDIVYFYYLSSRKL